MPWSTSVRSSVVRPFSPRRPLAEATGWGLEAIFGRLCELSALPPAVTLTPTLKLIRDAQHADETVAWVTTTHSVFFPPDAASFGIDLQALVVIRASRVESLGRAADQLARSGGFGLIVVDLGSFHPFANTGLDLPVTVAMPLQSRLLGLAQKHRAAVVFLSRKPDDSPSLSSLVSLRGSVERHTHARRSLRYELTALKDKQRAPGWSHSHTALGPLRRHVHLSFNTQPPPLTTA